MTLMAKLTMFGNVRLRRGRSFPLDTEGRVSEGGQMSVIGAIRPGDTDKPLPVLICGF